MMYAKARLFNDLETAQKILNATHPKEQKRLGRQVQGFDQDLWDDRKVGILRAGLREKFRQSQELNRVLLGTGDSMLVEASPYDRIWGVGLGMNDPRILNPENWQGENLLGQVLMQIRSELHR